MIPAAGAADLSALGTVPGQCADGGIPAAVVFLPTCRLIVQQVARAPPPAAALHYEILQLLLPSFADNYMSAQPGGPRLHDL
ncbi:MAG: hypothetical protein M3325_02775 [Actinomycetota bacterium]|nr:hypothetical protein [Actinomycetota bacterium]